MFVAYTITHYPDSVWFFYIPVHIQYIGIRQWLFIGGLIFSKLKIVKLVLFGIRLQSSFGIIKIVIKAYNSIGFSSTIFEWYNMYDRNYSCGDNYYISNWFYCNNFTHWHGRSIEFSLIIIVLKHPLSNFEFFIAFFGIFCLVFSV